MQYETIILELLSRIKKLEDEVAALKQAQNRTINIQTYNDEISNEEDNYTAQMEPTVPYKKMTDEMIDICYKSGKQVIAGESIQE